MYMSRLQAAQNTTSTSSSLLSSNIIRFVRSQSRASSLLITRE